jgi:hypothetical protein
VDHEVDEVQEHPLTLAVPFDAGADLLGPQTLLDCVRDRLNVTERGAAADDEVVCKGGKAAEIEDDEVQSLSVEEGINGCRDLSF